MAATSVLAVLSATYTADYDSGDLTVSTYTTLELDINLTAAVGQNQYVVAQLYRKTTNNEYAPFGPPVPVNTPNNAGSWASADYGPSSSPLWFMPNVVKLHISVPLADSGDSATFSVSLWGK